jgi:hypothetical protein
MTGWMPSRGARTLVGGANMVAYAKMRNILRINIFTNTEVID